jgi:hypothetical protein
MTVAVRIDIRTRNLPINSTRYASWRLGMHPERSPQSSAKPRIVEIYLHSPHVSSWRMLIKHRWTFTLACIHGRSKRVHPPEPAFMIAVRSTHGSAGVTGGPPRTPVQGCQKVPCAWECRVSEGPRARQCRGVRRSPAHGSAECQKVPRAWGCRVSEGPRARQCRSVRRSPRTPGQECQKVPRAREWRSVRMPPRMGVQERQKVPAHTSADVSEGPPRTPVQECQKVPSARQCRSVRRSPHGSSGVSEGPRARQCRSIRRSPAHWTGRVSLLG